MSNRQATDTFKECSNTNAQGVCMYRGPCLECAVNSARATLRAGDTVYRVVEIDYPGNHRPHSWDVQAIKVVSASPNQVKLERQFSDLHRVIFKADYIGRSFQLTLEDAIAYFASRKGEEIESLTRRRAEAARALAWAEDAARDAADSERDELAQSVRSAFKGKVKP